MAIPLPLGNSKPSALTIFTWVTTDGELRQQKELFCGWSFISSLQHNCKMHKISIQKLSKLL